MFNIPNGLTMTRMFGSLGIFPVLAFEQDTWAWVLFATVAFTFLCATDFLDGFLARRWDQCTPFGECLDPIADKLLVLLTIVALLKYHNISYVTMIAMVLVIFREISVNGFRTYLAQKTEETIPSPLGAKVKTFVQMVGLGLMLVGEALNTPFSLPFNYVVTVHTIGEAFFVVGATLGVFGAFKYAKVLSKAL